MVKLAGWGVGKVFDRLLRLLTETDTTLAEFGSSTTLVLIGIILAGPDNSLNPVIPLFARMTAIMPELAWAILFITLGALQAAANLVRSHSLRRASSFVSFLFFGFIGFLGASVHPISLFGAMCKVQSFVQGVAYLHLGARGGESET